MASGTEAVLRADWYLSRREVMFCFAVDMVVGECGSKGIGRESGWARGLIRVLCEE